MKAVDTAVAALGFQPSGTVMERLSAALVAESTSSKIFAVDGEPVGAAVTVVAL